MSSICTSDLHIKHGSVPGAVKGITVGLEMVGVVEEIGRDVHNVKPGDRVTVNVETFYMYGKNLIFKTGGVDGCNCAETLELIRQGRIDTTWLITHKYPLSRIEEAYHIFENKLDNVIKTAIYPD